MGKNQALKQIYNSRQLQVPMWNKVDVTLFLAFFGLFVMNCYEMVSVFGDRMSKKNEKLPYLH